MIHLFFPKVIYEWIAFSYDQKMFWRLHEESHPFSNIDFAPSITLGALKLGRYGSLWLFPIEHRSNGQSGKMSRSTNSYGAGYSYETRRSNWKFLGQIDARKFYLNDPENQDYNQYGDSYNLRLSIKRQYETIEVGSTSDLSFSRLSNPRFSAWRQDLTLKFLKKGSWPLFVLESYLGYNENFLSFRDYNFNLRGGISFQL